MEYLTLFQQESRHLHHHRVDLILRVVMVMMLFFSLLDTLLVPARLGEFLSYRLLAVAGCALLLAANRHDQGGDRAGLIGFCAYLGAGLVMVLTIHRMGGGLSPYSVGLIVIMTLYTALAPLTTIQTLFSGFALVLVYLLSLFWAESFTPAERLNLFSTLFFMVCFVLIAATQSWADTAARMEECRLRTAANGAAAALARQADTLEESVKRRTEEQRLSEKRYQILYEAMVDDVVLITARGKVLQANSSYLRHFCSGTRPEDSSFFDAVHPQDQEQVRAVLADAVERGAAMTAWQLTLWSTQGEPVAVEISASPLHCGPKRLGLQLVIRDIGVRRQLEQALVASLTKVRQTENAAILALAKLSEYRDRPPGHHLERVREYCRVLALELEGRAPYRAVISPDYIQNLYQGAILHDIGKVAVPDTILAKTSPLSAEEEQLRRQHTLAGAEVIKAMAAEGEAAGFLALAVNIACFHHERWDGQGYPQGLRGEDIPLEARIMALVDCYETLTVGADGESALSHSQVMARIAARAGQQLDPMLVEAMTAVQGDFDRIRHQLAETVTAA